MAGNKRPKVLTPVRLPREVHERIMAMLYHAPKGRTLQSLAETAITEAITEIERTENRGRPWKLPEKE